MAVLAQISRHPIKGIGSQDVPEAVLSPRGALHGDRAWAMLHGDAPDTDAWQARRHYLVVARGPALAAIEAQSSGERIVLTRAGAAPLDFDPATEAQALRDWIAPVWPADAPAPARLVRAPGHGMTDMPDAFVSIGNLASLESLGQAAGMVLDRRRFRMNLWLDHLSPWEETEWVNRRLTVGEVTLEVDQMVGRCRAPEANPETGRRDVITNKVLTEIGQGTNFGIYARVLTGGTIRAGDQVSLQ